MNAWPRNWREPKIIVWIVTITDFYLSKPYPDIDNSTVIEVQNTGNANVSGFVRKWRAGRDENDNVYVIEIMK